MLRVGKGQHGILDYPAGSQFPAVRLLVQFMSTSMHAYGGQLQDLEENNLDFSRTVPI